MKLYGSETISLFEYIDILPNKRRLRATKTFQIKFTSRVTNFDGELSIFRKWVLNMKVGT
jgi:hypothetical protein